MESLIQKDSRNRFCHKSW